jgi:S-DNA-T family DNA segregation ATPase FtsK/SpoIIIE
VANRFRRPVAEEVPQQDHPEAHSPEPTEPQPKSKRGRKPRVKAEWLLSPEGKRALRLGGGVFLLLLSVYVAFAALSHLFTYTQDQSLELLSPEAAANWAGQFGALVAEQLLQQGFGIIGLLIPVVTGLLAILLLNSTPLPAYKRHFLYFLAVLYWVSAFAGLVTLTFGLKSLLWAGNIGLYLAEWGIFLIGRIGLLLVLGFMGYLAALPWLKTQPRWVTWLATRWERLMPATGEAMVSTATPDAPQTEPQSAVATAKDLTGVGSEADFFSIPELNLSDTAPDSAQTPTEAEPETQELVPALETAGVAVAAAPLSEPLMQGDFSVVVTRAEPQIEMKTGKGYEPEPIAQPNPVLQAIREYEAKRAQGALGLGGGLPPIQNRTTPFLAPHPEPQRADIPTENDPEYASTPDEYPLAGNTSDILRQPQGRLAQEVEFTIETAPETEELPATNVYAVGANTFARLIPEADQATLDDEDEVGDWEAYDPTKDLPNYQFPTLELLKAHEQKGGVTVQREELEYSKNLIIETLLNFKIEIDSIKATIGPTVTLYEIVPKPHIRISKIKGLEDDIAMRLEALSSRIIAPIPGKGTIGIEVPNSRPELVGFRSLLATEKFRDFQGELPIAFGKTVTNEVFVGDLTKMPHLLVAGATGQGKSVGLNCILASLLYKKHPSQVKFVLIDPKKVEMNLFEALRHHYLAALPDMDEPIITDTKQVLRVLNSLCVEMDARYELLKMARTRNLLEYNEKFRARRLNPEKGHRYLPYIVLVIDELADLMMTAGKEVETPICRLAQLARAIGIHLVVATQRPSVDIITGKIKANFPARVSYRVMSKVDSRTVLDGNGAEQLIGRGDMLLKSGSEQVRLQNGFIDTAECEQIVEFIAAQPGYSEPYQLPEVADPEGEDSDDAAGLDPAERDPLFAEAARLVVMHQQGSTSLIQRRMKLGYNRAGRIMDQLERAGIVGGNSGSKAREVLVADLNELELYL